MKALLPALLLPSLLSGCAWIDDIGEKQSEAIFDLGSPQELDDDGVKCAVAQFPLQFLSFDADDDTGTRLRMYESIEKPLDTNYMMIQFADNDAETLAPCDDIEVGKAYTITTNGCVQARLQFNACDEHPTLRLHGTLTFDTFNLTRGERISGTLVGTLIAVQQYSTSTTTLEKETPIASFTGAFDFVNHVGAIWSR